MSNLPQPIDLTQPLPARPRPDRHYTSKEEKPKYDLDKMHKIFKAAKEELDDVARKNPILPEGFVNPTTLLYELIDRDIWRLRGSEVIGRYIGFSKRYKSLTVSLMNQERR